MRSFAIALVMLTATVTRPASVAAEEMQDVRLQVTRLTRPPGEQAARLTGRVAPSAAGRLVTVTVDVDGSVATLTGKIARSGRVQAAGRRLDLAAALAPFDEIAVTLSDASLEASTFVAADCVRKARTRTLDCRNPTGPIGGPGVLRDGVYDAALDYGYGVEHGLARLTSASDGTRGLRIHRTDLDAAWFTLAPDFTLTGWFILGGDAFVSASGSAVDSSSSSSSRLEGNAASTGGLPMQLAFDLSRPVAGTPSALGGAWAFAFQNVGTMTLVLTLGSDGAATTAPTTIFGSSGEPRYTVRASTCSVAPGGGLYCLLGIDSPPGVQQLQLFGALDLGSDGAQGRFTLGPPPVISTQGTWSATR